MNEIESETTHRAAVLRHIAVQVEGRGLEGGGKGGRGGQRAERKKKKENRMEK